MTGLLTDLAQLFLLDGPIDQLSRLRAPQGVELVNAASDSDRLANVEAVVRVYRAKLDVAVTANRDDPRFVTGVTHALTAMDRLARALAGETDPVKLGIADPETQPSSKVVTLEDLFSGAGEQP